MWQYYAWSYYRQVEMVDAAMGRILDALENSPHADNTLVVFSSDHGDAMGCHRLVHKLSLYDAAVRVPMIVSWPGHVAENRVDRTHLVSGFDLAPTLCDYAGTAPPPDMRGPQPARADRGRRPAWREYVVAHNYVVGRMVRSARYKYIAYQGDRTDQLFDMVDDPGETRNLAADAAAAGPLAEHRRMLAEWESQLKPLAEPPGGWLQTDLRAASEDEKPSPHKGRTSCMASTVRAEELFGLDMLAAHLADFEPPQGPHDPAGAWQLEYRTYSLAASQAWAARWGAYDWAASRWRRQGSASRWSAASRVQRANLPGWPPRSRPVPRRWPSRCAGRGRARSSPPRPKAPPLSRLTRLGRTGSRRCEVR